MASNVAPPKNTGGGGFVFENDVCAWFLSAMLVGETIFGVESGAPIQIDFQTRVDGWFLDDALITTSTGSGVHRFSFSIKSDAQFTAKSAPADFVSLAWEQWLHIGSTLFDCERDYMGLVTGPCPAAAGPLSGLVNKVHASDPNSFSERLATPNWANEDERSLFASFACPTSLGRTTSDVDTARLLQRLRFFHHDFGVVASASQNGAIELCRRAVRSHMNTDAQALWTILREVAAELRPVAGSLTLKGLVDRLRARVELADYPDHAADWATLEAASKREASLVRDSIADRVRLPRHAQVKDTTGCLSANNQVSLLGSSGVGKSAIARQVFEQRIANGSRTLWIHASSLDRAQDFGAFETSLQLRHNLGELLAQETSREPVIIIDGIDRLYSEAAFRNVAALIRSTTDAPRITPWRVLLVCQSQEWPRVVEAIQRAGAPADAWHSVEVKALAVADLEPVRQAVSALGRLLLQPRVGTLLTNLKLLDLVVRRLSTGTNIDAAAWVGESSVAEWFWAAEIDRGADKLLRGKVARSLAQSQADRLEASTSVDSLGTSMVGATESLAVDQIVVQLRGDRLAFAHDLYGDWTRLRILVNHRADLVSFLQGRYQSPLWHRAIRLLGIHLLERDGGMEEWKALMAAFARGEMTVVQDLLLEAPAFATNARDLLESTFPDLIAGNGELLRRLLNRFLAFATVPNEQMVTLAAAVGIKESEARAACRRPHWPYWLDVVAVLHRHRNDAIRVAAPEVAKIVEMWLTTVSPGSVLRREASELGVQLGRRALDTQYAHRDSKEEKRRCFKCALLAAAEMPEEVSEFARIAAERVPRSTSEPDTTPRRQVKRSLATGSVPEPWPDGPHARVDDEFQRVVLDDQVIVHLFRLRPAIAREVVLATLIEEPKEERWGTRNLSHLGFSYRNDWHPASFTRGPFLAFLRESFAEGLELIARIVEYATERAKEFGADQANQWRVRWAEQGVSEDEAEKAIEELSKELVLHDGEKTHAFAGDAGSYCWSAGVTSQTNSFSPLPPAVVASALMALEQYFYQRIDAGNEVDEDIATVFSRSRCTALLGVLCDIGKREPVLFEGPLKALLSGPEVYSWDIEKACHSRTHFYIGEFALGVPVAKLAREFHEFPHRRLDLRRVAMVQVLTNGKDPFFATIRQWWEARQAKGEFLGEMTGQLEAILDAANYELRKDVDGHRRLVNVALENLQSRSFSGQQATNDQLLVLTFPTRCREVLDKSERLNDAVLEQLWVAWQRIGELAAQGPALPDGEVRFGDEYANAITGGIALFFRHHDWLFRTEARREKVESALFAVLDAPPPRHGLEDNSDFSTWTWDCFAAESVATRWILEPKDERWRRLVAQAVFARKYGALQLLFARCAEHRATLGEDFERLRKLAVDWAHVRDRHQVLRRSESAIPAPDKDLVQRLREVLRVWMDQAIASFVDGSSGPLPSDWSISFDAERFNEFEQLRHQKAGSRRVDLSVIRSSHEWLPLPDQTSSPDERKAVVQFWRTALDIICARPATSLRERKQDLHDAEPLPTVVTEASMTANAGADSPATDMASAMNAARLRYREPQFPDDEERWALGKVADVVIQLQASEHSELLWRPIIDLHTEASHWPKFFLDALHLRALPTDEVPPMYGPLVREIVTYALAEVDGRPRWDRQEDVWDALLGLDFTVADSWRKQHAGHVASNWEVVALWMDQAPRYGRRIGTFARWLAGPAAAAVRLKALPWLYEHRRACEKRAGDALDEIGKLLSAIWDQDETRLRATPDSFTAFRRLLTWLVHHQNVYGLELQGRIGGLA